MHKKWTIVPGEPWNVIDENGSNVATCGNGSRTLAGKMGDIVNAQRIVDLHNADASGELAATKEQAYQYRGQLQAMERRAHHAEERVRGLERDNAILNGAQTQYQQECARLVEQVAELRRTDDLRVNEIGRLCARIEKLKTGSRE